MFASSRPIAALSAEERMRRIRADRWINIPRGAAGAEMLEDLIAFPQRARMPNLLIVGESGMGKTMIVEKFARDHPAHFDAVNGLKRMPVVVVQMVSGPDEARFYKRLLAAIGAPEPTRATWARWKVWRCGCCGKPGRACWSSTRCTVCRRARSASRRAS